MIPAMHPYRAIFNVKLPGDGGRTFPEPRPVVAWSDDGEALVVDRHGDLRPAATIPGFTTVCEDTPGITGVVPGGGWRIAWKADDGTEFVEDVLAWTVTANGRWEAHSADINGYVEAVDTTISQQARFIPPGVDPLSATESAEQAAPRGTDTTEAKP